MSRDLGAEVDPFAMSKIQFSAIEPLIESKKILAGSVVVTLRCAESTRSVRAQAPLSKVSPRRVSVWTSVQRSAQAAIADALGTEVQGKQHVDVRDNDIQCAIVAAFESVQGSFRWDEEQHRWFETSREQSSFQQRLKEMPVTDPGDQSIMLRVLLELSKSDGVVSTEELLFISEFVNPSVASMEELLRLEPLTTEELSSTTQRARSTIVMLAWACALCDETLDPAEKLRIAQIAEALGLSATESDRLRVDAQNFLMHQALATAYPGGVRDEEAFAEVSFAAKRLGVAEDATKALDQLFRGQLEGGTAAPDSCQEPAA